MLYENEDGQLVNDIDATKMPYIGIYADELEAHDDTVYGEIIATASTDSKNITDGIWTPEAPTDLSTVKAIAVHVNTDKMTDGIRFMVLLLPDGIGLSPEVPAPSLVAVGKTWSRNDRFPIFSV